MQQTLMDQALHLWEEEIVARNVTASRWADGLVPDIVFDVLHQQGLDTSSDALESEIAETLRTALFAEAAIRFPGDWR